MRNKTHLEALDALIELAGAHPVDANVLTATNVSEAFGWVWGVTTVEDIGAFTLDLLAALRKTEPVLRFTGGPREGYPIPMPSLAAFELTFGRDIRRTEILRRLAAVRASWVKERAA